MEKLKKYFNLPKVTTPPPPRKNPLDFIPIMSISLLFYACRHVTGFDLMVRIQA